MFLHLSVILFTGGGSVQHALQVVSQHALQQVSRGDGIPAWLAGFQAHTQEGELRGLARWGVSKPTPKGEVKGFGLGRVSRPTPGGLQAHTGGISRATPRGVSRPTPRGVCIPACTEADSPLDSYCCGRYACYWNAILSVNTLIMVVCQKNILVVLRTENTD